MTKKAPLVSVLMPVYNTERYLHEAIDSILRQTFTDFEFIIINDGSTDSSQKIINHYAKIDSRIVTVKQKNMGLVKTLNKGIELAKGTYIARIDGDDPAFETRLEKQVKIIEKSKKTVLVGGGFEIIDENGFFLETIHPPTRDKDLRRTMMLRNPFGHASALFRKDAAIKAGLYSGECGPTEDQELWIRLSKIGNLATVSEPVYRYRINMKGISQSNSERQANETKKHLGALWAEITPEVLSRDELKEQGQRYVDASIRKSYGIGMKEQFLADNAQIGVKLIRYKYFTQGIAQLWNVATTGRTGFKAVRKRLRQLNGGSLKQIKE